MTMADQKMIEAFAAVCKTMAAAGGTEDGSMGIVAVRSGEDQAIYMCSTHGEAPAAVVGQLMLLITALRVRIDSLQPNNVAWSRLQDEVRKLTDAAYDRLVFAATNGEHSAADMPKPWNNTEWLR